MKPPTMVAHTPPTSTYTYKVYSKTGCNSANEIASVTFTTPSS